MPDEEELRLTGRVSVVLIEGDEDCESNGVADADSVFKTLRDPEVLASAEELVHLEACTVRLKSAVRDTVEVAV